MFSQEGCQYQFTSTIAKKLAIRYRESYEEFKGKLDNLQKVAPQEASRKLGEKVEELLSEVMDEICQFVREKNQNQIEP